MSKYKERETENAVIEAESASPLAGFEPVTPKKQGGFKLEPKAELPDVPEAPAKTERPQQDAWDGYTVPEPVRERNNMTVGMFLDTFRRCLTESMADAELRVNGVTVEELGFDVRVKNERVFVDLLTREAQ